ncbi:hypothetical protein HDU97_004711 [Phlyctochytrium planicorne]|nr:hypothetical protein HDU97_004711 [Phlyctochytrium planicorne]
MAHGGPYGIQKVSANLRGDVWIISESDKKLRQWDSERSAFPAVDRGIQDVAVRDRVYFIKEDQICSHGLVGSANDVVCTKAGFAPKLIAASDLYLFSVSISGVLYSMALPLTSDSRFYETGVVSRGTRALTVPLDGDAPVLVDAANRIQTSVCNQQNVDCFKKKTAEQTSSPPIDPSSTPTTPPSPSPSSPSQPENPTRSQESDPMRTSSPQPSSSDSTNQPVSLGSPSAPRGAPSNAASTGDPAASIPIGGVIGAIGGVVGLVIIVSVVALSTRSKRNLHDDEIAEDATTDTDSAVDEQFSNIDQQQQSHDDGMQSGGVRDRDELTEVRRLQELRRLNPAQAVFFSPVTIAGLLDGDSNAGEQIVVQDKDLGAAPPRYTEAADIETEPKEPALEEEASQEGEASKDKEKWEEVGPDDL